MAIISKLIEGLTNDVEHFVRVYPINPKGFAQSELDGQVVSAIPVAYDPNTLLLLHLDGDLQDKGSLQNTVANGGVSFTTDSKFGGKAVNGFAASKGLKVANNNAFNFGSGNFTIEFWVKFTSVSAGYQTLIDRRGTTDGTGWLILVEQGNYLAFLASSGSSWSVNLNFGDIADYLNKWVHIAVVRNGNTVTAYVNGIVKATTTTSISINSVSTDISIGVGSSLITSGLTANHYLRGCLDEVRISKVARYTATFTPQTEAHAR